LATAVKNWFWNLPSGEDIPKKFPFLWPNRLFQKLPVRGVHAQAILSETLQNETYETTSYPSK
jgi:hypothetical protein